MDDIERYARVSAGFGTRVAGVDDWGAPTPCDEWTVTQLVQHVVDTHHRIQGEAATGSGGAHEPVAQQWRRAQTATAGMLADPAVAQAVREVMGSEMTFAQLVGGLLCADLLLHTWDLARASGQDEGLDANAVEDTRSLLLPMDASLRRPGGFGPRLDPPPGADAQTALLAFAGRRA